MKIPIQFKLSLKNKALLGIIFVLLPIFITFLIVYNQNRTYLKQRILDTLTVIAEAYEGQVYQFLERTKMRAQDFASDGFIRTQLQKAVRGNTSAFSKLNKHLIKNKIVLDKTINAVCILSLEGRVVASTDKAKIGKELSKEDCFVKGQKSTAITESLNKHMGLPEIRISTPIFAKETGRPIGVLVNCILISELNKLLAGEYVKEQGAVSWGKGSGAWKTLEIYLVNRDKLMITKSIFVEDAILKQIVDTLPVNLCLTSSEEMAGFYKDYRGVEVVGASMYIPSMKWALLIEIDKSEVLSPIRHVLISALITAAVVIVMIVLLFAGFIKKMVVPLRKISDAAKKIASGNFDVVVPVQTHDEIGVLCESFNYMTHHIKARTTALTRSEARLAEAQQIAQIGNWEWDVIKNEVSWSYEVYRIFGLTQESFVSPFETFLNHIHPDDREFAKKTFDDALYHKKPLDIDHRIILKDASVRTVHEKAVVISDSKGRAVQMVGTVQDITERKRAEEEVVLLKTLILSISESKDLRDALVVTLEKVCSTTGWIYGEAWIPDPEGKCLVRDHAFYSRVESLEEFSELSGTFTFPHGVGLPGRAWSIKKPVWVQDVTIDSNYPRAAIAKEAGLKAGVAFPVFSDTEIVAVLVFYMLKTLERDERLVSFVSSVVVQLGEVIKRKIAEKAVMERSRLATLDADVGFALIQKGTLREILQLCADALVRNLNMAFARIWTLNKEENVLELQSSAGIYTHIDGPHSRVPVGRYKIGLIAEERKPHLTNKVIGDTRVHDQEWARKTGMVAFAGYPLMIEDRLVGVMAMFARQPLKEFTLKALASVSDVIALGIERKHIEETKARLSEITETTTDFVGTATIDGRVLYINKAGRKVIGIGENENISNLSISDCHPKWASELILTEGIPDAIREGAWIGETAFLSRDDREIPISQVIIVHKNPDGTIRNLSTIGRDISDRKRFEEQMTYMANRDPLTNLLNRRHFHEDMEGWLAQTRRFGIKGAVLFLDLDNFKYINDSLGHQAGDKLLISIADLLRERLRETDILARLGGDEFAIILPHADVNLAESVAKQIRELVQYHTSVEENYHPAITVSIGIALFPGHGDTVETLLAHADLAMYRAKEEGRNRVCIYTPERKTPIESRLVWEKSIREALNRDNFVLFLQPIMDIRQNLIVGHEALLRMINEKGETVTPSSFLDIAERFGLIHDIDHWVVRRAIHLIQELKQDNKPTYLEVNLSGRSYADKQLLPLIRNELTETGIDPASLVFEITETAFIENMAAAQLFIAELKSLGFRFALDDFGIGFSSFNYLKHLPVDYLKIDGSFVRNLPHDTVAQHLVKAMVEVSRGLGKKTIAEFVENEEIMRLLREYGVDYAQGYHIGKPRHVSEL
jgi:diguanylate cyclase (GGDEF)-like protein/PAS domain S-box-containing protein